MIRPGPRKKEEAPLTGGRGFSNTIEHTFLSVHQTICWAVSSDFPTILAIKVFDLEYSLPLYQLLTSLRFNCVIKERDIVCI